MSPTFGELAGFNMSRRTSLGGVCALLNLLPLPPPAVGVSPGGGVSLPSQQVALGTREYEDSDSS